ncbi:hypothetical protein B9T33_08630 [Acinetobacter sp. ANC 5054]|uniref:AAA family ATPase n=1 Tax=Acinetobacter sp. ANC 5054 TaxID=1977877 RepID=UPI000A3462A4|nr:AAA family ATPase [Acinetobacter sp. ANC 5054]OTG80484.1 hypothetical protein B9T33_08630 [Acinetobacter sp. ANC 5054]
MKILSIRIKNLASLGGEHFIDFEAQPLLNAGLIAITGKTGAGKSTILDAMCLALFNQIPRFKHSDAKLLDNDGTTSISTNFTSNILRRGTTQGFAELNFMAQDQKIYSARWEVKRSHNKVNGKLQKATRTLRCLSDGNIVADRATTFDESIKRITQLSFAQFTRAVLLAQSEVTAFLQARDDDRAELLEYLTNSSIFAKIGALAFRKKEDISQQRRKLEDVVGHLELLSEEQITQLHTDFSQAQYRFKQTELQLQQHQQEQKWFEQQTKLNVDIQQRQQLLEQCKQQLLNLAPEHAQLQQLDRFATIRSSVAAQQKLQLEQSQYSQKVQVMQQQFAIVEQNHLIESQRFQQVDEQFSSQQHFEQQHYQALNQVRQSVEQRKFIKTAFEQGLDVLERQQNALIPLNQQHAQFLQTIQQQDVEIQQIQQQLNTSQPFSVLDDGLNAHIQQLNQFNQQYSLLSQRIGHMETAQQNLIELNNQHTELFKQFGSVENIEAKLTESNQLLANNQQKQKQSALIQQKLESWLELKQSTAQIQHKQHEAETILQTTQQQTELSEIQFKQAQSEREQLQHLLQQQRLLHAENIEQLRETLVDQQPCSVCGSTEHPYALEHPDLSKALFQLQEQQEQQALLSEKQYFEQWQQHLKQFNQQLAAQQQLKHQLEQAQQQIQRLQTEVNSAMSHAELVLNLEQTDAQLRAVVDSFISNLLKQQQAFIEQNSTYAQALKQLNQLNLDIQNLEHVLNQLQQLHHQVEHLFNIESRIKALSEQQPEVAAQQLIQQLTTRSDQLQQLQHIQNQQQQLTQQSALLDEKISQLKVKIEESTRHNQHLRQQGIENNDQAAEAIFAMCQTQISKPHEWLAQFDQSRLALQNQHQQAKVHFSSIHQHFEQQRQQLDQLKTQTQQVEQQHIQVQQDIQHWLNAHADFNHDLLIELNQIPIQHVQALRVKLQQAEQAQYEAQSSLKVLQDQFEQHQTQQPKLSLTELHTQLEVLQAQFEQQQNERDALKVKIEMHQQTLIKQQQFANEIAKIQIEETRWNKISSLIGDAKGKDFREFAQQYNLDILVEYANQQLALLSQRYTLKRLENSLSLGIIDHDMDGELRSVSSLSGGESFLTALALSLAIANMASGSMKIESLFIDEGFGTLDASSLHMVMNALDQLQNQGRKVVLISHIQEMHERIPVQIQVNPVGAGASTIEIVC